MPRHHLVHYHGVLAPNAKLRKYIVPATARTRPAAKRKTDHKKHKPTTDTLEQDALIAPLTWAQRLKRVFDIDITICLQMWWQTTGHRRYYRSHHHREDPQSRRTGATGNQQTLFAG